MKHINIQINNKKLNVKLCGSYFSKLKGLMFSKKLKENEGFLFQFSKERKWKIHMVFVFFPIDIVWLNKDMKVVDIQRGNPFDLLLEPRKEAKYILELNVNSGIKIGNKLKVYK